MSVKRTTRKLRRAVDAVEAAAGPLPALAEARRLREAAEALEIALVVAARAERRTWTEIGEVYGTSKQGAQQRFRAAIQPVADG